MKDISGLPRPNQPSTSHNPISPRVIATQPLVRQRRTRSNTPMPTIHEETTQALQRIHTRDNKNKPVHEPIARPRRTIAQYKQQQATITQATPTKLPDVPRHHYITQDENEAHLANLLFQDALPKIQQSQNKIHIASPNTPCGITSHALYHLVGSHLVRAQHSPICLRLSHRTYRQRCRPSCHKRNNHKV